MPNKHDLSGQRFGRLTALFTVPNNNYRTRWHCICDCGKTKDVLQQNLENGHVRSCGCLHAERNKEKIANYNSVLGRESHNETKSRLYRIWIGIKARCYDANSTAYKNYGARGITVCDDWRYSYLSFKEWAITNGYSDNLSIDRIDTNGNYFPDNCRWVSTSVQQFNKRTPKRNTSGCVGVSWNKASKKWVANISIDSTRHFLGAFDSINDAIAARKAAEEKYYNLV